MNIPKGYKLKEGVEFDTQLGRFRWHPKKDDLFYFEEKKTIFKYLEWVNMLPNCFMSLDGYAKVKDITEKRGFWVNNIEVRKCIPIEVV